MPNGGTMPYPAASPIGGQRGHIGASNGPNTGYGRGPTVGSMYAEDPGPGHARDANNGADMWRSQARIRQPGTLTGPKGVDVGIVSRWGGFSRVVGIFSPKLGYRAALTSHGFPSTWDTLRLVPANPSAAQGLQRRTRPVIPSFGQRGGGYVGIPGVFVPVRSTRR